MDVADIVLVTIFECWWHLTYFNDIFVYIGANYDHYGQKPLSKSPSLTRIRNRNPNPLSLILNPDRKL